MGKRAFKLSYAGASKNLLPASVGTGNCGQLLKEELKLQLAQTILIDKKIGKK